MQDLWASLQEMAKRVSLANQGTGKAVAVIEELNLSARTLNSLAPDEQFLRIADAINKVTNPNDQIRIADRLGIDVGL